MARRRKYQPMRQSWMVTPDAKGRGVVIFFGVTPRQRDLVDGRNTFWAGVSWEPAEARKIARGIAKAADEVSRARRSRRRRGLA